MNYKKNCFVGFLSWSFLLLSVESRAAESHSRPALKSTVHSADPYQILDLRHGSTYVSDDLLLTSGPVLTTHLGHYTGQNIILYFWDLKCTDCEKQWKEVVDLKKAASREDVKFLPIFSGDPDEGTRAHQFVSDLQGKIPYWIAAPGFSRDQFISNGLPATFFISSDNQIVASLTAFATGLLKRI